MDKKAQAIVMKKSTRLIIAAIIIAGSFGNCQVPKDKQAADPVLSEAISWADSSRRLLQRLQVQYENLQAVNEFEALKLRNNHDMIADNLQYIEAFIASAGNDPEEAQAQLLTQTEFLKALLAAGEAILNENSLSFGQWVSSPAAIADSVMTPVKKVQ